ncbi:MAG: hypothetical protein ACLQQB_09235 [Solirubrobacteraceae bacterium]|jgi:hypothetical protein
MTLLQRRHRAVYRVYSEDEYLAGVDPFADWDAPMVELTEVAAPELREVAAPELTEMTVHIAGQYAPPVIPAATVGAGISRERRLRRLAGAAALTGAVGTVGVTVGLVGLRSHPGDRQIAVVAVSTPARSAPSIGGGPRVVMASPTRVTLRRETVHRVGAWQDGGHRGDTQRASARGESTRVARSGQGRPRAGAAVAAKAANVRVAQAAPTREPQPEQATYTPVASTPQETSAPAASAAQSTPTETAPAARAQSEFGFEH